MIDLVKNTTDFRKTEYKGSVGTGGVFINKKYTWLTSYVQRPYNRENIVTKNAGKQLTRFVIIPPLQS